MVYASSLLVELLLTEIHIHVDGQNITQIKQYQNTTRGGYSGKTGFNWNPCLPIPFSIDTSVTITFDGPAFENWRNWYPLEICDYQKNTIKYDNDCLFKGDKLTLNNLTMDNYFVDDNTNYIIMTSFSRRYDVIITSNNIISAWNM